MGDNVTGPSLIRAPDWLERPLGRYYLFFADHSGSYIRLAYADELLGPWRTHAPGVLPMELAGFGGHVASPDVHVDDRRGRCRDHGALAHGAAPVARTTLTGLALGARAPRRAIASG